MSKVTIYQFRTYDITNDEYRISHRWATMDAIKNIARGDAIESSAMEVDKSVVLSDIHGMTVRGWMPAFLRTGPQAQVNY